MNRPALLVLVRHGQSERNVVKKRNRFYLDEESRKAVKGIPDHRITLTAEGHRRAVETGHALRDQFGAFDYVFHSGCTRAIQTPRGSLPRIRRRTARA
jgi:broad specificity phosphatase PhoE